MTREAFIQFVNGEGNNAGLNNSGWRSFKQQLLGVGVLEQSSSAVGVHFYSNVPLTQTDSLYGPWLATQLLSVFGEDCEVKVPRHKIEKNMVREGYAAEVRLQGVRFDNSTENDDRIRSFGQRFANFLTRCFGNNADAVNARNTYFNENSEFVTMYAERRRNPQQRWGLSREELMARSLSDDNTFQRNATPKAEGAMPSLNGTIRQLLLSNLNVILTGAPGTGKTYTAKEVAKDLSEDEWVETEGKWKFGRIASVQFHPGYDYSDFVIGMKPVLLSDKGKELEMKNGKYVLAGTETEISDIGDATVSFRWKDGIFKEFADRAKNDLGNNYVFLIDEINRADLSRVFGELFSLLEEEYRYPNGKGSDFILLPNGDRFSIPENLYIIGTMNDIDRSVESMDFALRRRFAWYEVKAAQSMNIIDNKAKQGKITEGDAEILKAKMKAVNRLVAPESGERSDNGTPDLRLGSEYQLGGAIFAKLEKYVEKDYNTGKPKDATPEAFKALWENHIKNILSEYLRGRRDRDTSLEKLYNSYNDAANVEKDSDNASNDHTRGKDIGFRIKCPNGKEIKENTGAASLCAFIKHVAEQVGGIGKIVDLNIRRSDDPNSKLLLVSDISSDNNRDYERNPIQGYYVLTKTDGPQKMKHITKIIEGLQLEHYSVEKISS